MKRSEAEALGVVKEKGGTKEDSNKRAKKGHGEEESAPRNPYVLFFGQLPFSTKQEHLQRHLAANGVGGVKSIRILTEPSGDSRGMAFVEMNTSADMYKALALHHTVLNGRRINVEKSCGGGKEAKRGRLESQRESQESAVREKIDAVIADYEKREIITKRGLGLLLLNRLYTYTAAQVGGLLDDFEKRPKAQRAVKHLDLLMDKQDEKLGRLNVPNGDKEGMDVEEGGLNE